MRDGAVAPSAVHTASVQQVQKASDKNINPIYYHDVMHSLPDSHFVWVSYDGGGGGVILYQRSHDSNLKCEPSDFYLKSGETRLFL